MGPIGVDYRVPRPDRQIIEYVLKRPLEVLPQLLPRTRYTASASPFPEQLAPIADAIAITERIGSE